MVRRGDAHLMDQERATATRIAAGSGWSSSGLLSVRLGRV